MATIQQEIKIVGGSEASVQVTALERGLRSLQGQASGSGREVGRLGHEIANLATSLATGRVGLQEIGLVALNLGRHLGEGGLAGAATKLGAVFTGALTNPVTIGIAGLSALGYAFRDVTTQVGETARSLDRQRSVLADVKEGYGKAAEEALKYSKIPGEAPSLDVANTQSNIRDLQKELNQQIQGLRARTRGAISGVGTEVYQEIKAATEKLASIPAPSLQDVIRYRQTLGNIQQSLAPSDSQRRFVEDFVSTGDTVRDTAKRLSEQGAAAKVLAEGLDPASRAYEDLSNAAADAADAVADSNRKIEASHRSVADAIEKSTEAQAKLTVQMRYGAQEQMLQAQQIQIFAPMQAGLGVGSAQANLRREQFNAAWAPQRAADSAEEARINLEEYQLTYGDQVNRIMRRRPRRGEADLRSLELERLDLRGRELEYQAAQGQFNRNEQPQQTSQALMGAILALREAIARRQEADISAGKAAIYGQRGLSPTGGPGPEEAVAKAERDVAAATDGIAQAQQEIVKALRDVARAIQAEADRNLALGNYIDQHKGTSKPGGEAGGGYITGPGTGTSDSIPARLSTGEYVINASAVRRIGVSNLDAINRYASGGIVLSGVPTGVPTAAGVTPVLMSATEAYRSLAMGGWSAGLAPALADVGRLAVAASDLAAGVMSQQRYALDLRTNRGDIPAYADDATIAAIRAAAIGDIAYSTGVRPTWNS